MIEHRQPSGGPRGRRLYLLAIDRLPDAWEPSLRNAATELRRRRLPIRLFRQRWIRRFRRSISRSERRARRVLRRATRRSRLIQRSVRRLQRSVTHRLRPARRATLRAGRAGRRTARRGLRRGRRENDRFATIADDGPDQSADAGAVSEPVEIRKRGRIARWLFPPVVKLPGTGNVVLVDAVGHSVDDILAAAPLFPERSIVATDDANVGRLRSAGLVYEYLPCATPNGAHDAESVSSRLAWIDYVYGIDEVLRLSDVAPFSSSTSSADR